MSWHYPAPQSEAAQAIRERLLKYRDKLFTFLRYDGVPWNNNNAENAIKQFAYFRERRPSIMKEAGLQDYLVLLSIYQTCRYKGLSFMKFLLSGERDIDGCFRINTETEPTPAQAPHVPKGFHAAALRVSQGAHTTSPRQKVSGLNWCLPKLRWRNSYR
jgi:hypothetical protein